MQESISKHFCKLAKDERLLREFQNMMNIKDPIEEYIHAKLREQSFADKIFKPIRNDSGP